MKHINNKHNFTENDNDTILKTFNDNCVLLESNCMITDSGPFTDSYGKWHMYFNYIFIYLGVVRSVSIECTEDYTINHSVINSKLAQHCPSMLMYIDNICSTKIYKDIEKVYNEVQEDLKSYKLLSVLK